MFDTDELAHAGEVKKMDGERRSFNISTPQPRLNLRERRRETTCITAPGYSPYNQLYSILSQSLVSNAGRWRLGEETFGGSYKVKDDQ